MTIHLQVEDVDDFREARHRRRREGHDADADMFWGDRYGQLEDPFGHRWSVATHVRDVSPEEMQKAMANMKMRLRRSGRIEPARPEICRLSTA